MAIEVLGGRRVRQCHRSPRWRAQGGRGPRRCEEVKFRGPLCSSAECGNSTFGGCTIFGFREGFSTNRQLAWACPRVHARVAREWAAHLGSACVVGLCRGIQFSFTRGLELIL
jgi:hypothetical protein